MAKKIKCPRLLCGSKQCVPVSSDGFKTGKGLLGGIVGGAALGPVGALAGVATGLNGKKKVKFVCQKCGKVFTAKI